MDLGRHLGLGATVVFARDTDDSTSIDDIVRSLEDAGGLQRPTVLVFG